MKYAINTHGMTPHDPARRFFPDFTNLTVVVGGKRYSGPAAVEMDDRGGAVLHFGEEPKAAEPVGLGVVESKPRPPGLPR